MGFVVLVRCRLLLTPLKGGNGCKTRKYSSSLRGVQVREGGQRSPGQNAFLCCYVVEEYVRSCKFWKVLEFHQDSGCGIPGLRPEVPAGGAEALRALPCLAAWWRGGWWGWLGRWQEGSVTESRVLARCTVPGARGHPLMSFFLFFPWACAMGSGTLVQLLDMSEWLSGYYCILLSAHLFHAMGWVLELLVISAFCVTFIFWHLAVTLVTPEIVILFAVQKLALNR